MKLIAVAVFDEAAQAFMQPGFVLSTGPAVRNFVDEINKAGSELNKHPQDYRFVQLGTWDDGSGAFENELRVLALGRDVVLTKQ